MKLASLGLCKRTPTGDGTPPSLPPRSLLCQAHERSWGGRVERHRSRIPSTTAHGSGRIPTSEAANGGAPSCSALACASAHPLVGLPHSLLCQART